MSVGKTTLVNALKNVPEFKDYHFATERSKYLNSLGIPLNTDSTLKGQNIFLAERCTELMVENVPVEAVPCPTTKLICPKSSVLAVWVSL